MALSNRLESPATSAIDYATDSIIQNSLRGVLGQDVTLITVAHRLQTIMDSDKIVCTNSTRIDQVPYQLI